MSLQAYPDWSEYKHYSPQTQEWAKTEYASCRVQHALVYLQKQDWTPQETLDLLRGIYRELEFALERWN